MARSLGGELDILGLIGYGGDDDQGCFDEDDEDPCNGHQQTRYLGFLPRLDSLYDLLLKVHRSTMVQKGCSRVPKEKGFM